MSTIDKAFDIIEAILNHEDGLRLSDLVDITGLNSSTAHRLCDNLIKRGYLFQHKKGSNYLLGFKFARLNILNTATTLKEQASTFLKGICDETSETVVLVIYYGITAAIVDIVISKQMIKVIPDMESYLPLHCTAVGKILLAHMSEQGMKNTIDNMKLNAYTDNTITDEDRLKEELEIVRNNGVAFDMEETLYGVMSVAAPIKGTHGKLLASISIVGPTPRVNSQKLRQFSSVLKKSTDALSHLLEYLD